MSLTQTYYLAHTARAKLSKEAARADHDLRLLVGHANLLDGLMIDLAEAEREQESWFNQTISGATSDEGRHVQWTDSLPAVVEDYEEDSENESDADGEDEDDEVSYGTAAPIRRFVSPPATTDAMDLDSDEEEDDEECYEHLQLTRTPSRSSPPELLHESDSDSEDDSMPPSPPAPEMQMPVFSEKERQANLAREKQQDSISDFYEEGFYLPQRQPVTVY